MENKFLEIARRLWKVVGNETNRRANTARRVGDAGLALIDAIEDVRSEITKNPEFSATLTVTTVDGARYVFGLVDLTQPAQPYYSTYYNIIGELAP